MVRIVIVDDQKMVREGIKILLEKTEKIEIVGDIAHGQEAIERIESLKPDIVLLDINMPEIDGFTVAEKIIAQSPEIKIIMLSGYEDASYVQKATEIGAKGYLLKSASSQELEWAIKLVARGYSAIKSELLEKQFAAQQAKQSALVLYQDSINNENKNSSALSVLPESRQYNSNKLGLLLSAKERSSHSKQLIKPRYSNLFHNVRLSNAKKTMKSFEFRLLVFIILFCLGFLVFVALV